MGLETDLGAWALDETCLIVGRMIEQKLNRKENPFDEMGKRGYASAKSTGKVKTMKVPENGIW
jgi:hypothetical protein